MSPAPKSRRFLRWRHLLWVVFGKVLLIVAAAAILIYSGAADRFLRGVIVRRLEAMTGGRVELRGFEMRWRHLHATLSGLTIHGREPAGTPPFFTAEKLDLDLRIDSFWGWKFSVESAAIEHPQVHVRSNEDGSTNVPLPKRTDESKLLPERLMELRIGRLRLNDGAILYNDVRVPLVAEGDEFHFTMDAASVSGAPAYAGRASWQHATIVMRRYLPFSADFSLKFTLERDSLTIEQFVCSAPHSQLDAQARRESFGNPSWTFRYRGWLNLDDIREILRKPLTPAGRVDFSGEGSFAAGQLHALGRYTAQNITTKYDWFHAAGMSSRGSYRVDNRGMEVPDFTGEVLGGRVQGRITGTFAGQAFRAETTARDIRLAEALAAVEHRNFPVRSLHWDARVSADTVTMWTADFKHVESSGLSIWSPPDVPVPGSIPVSARWTYRYRKDQNTLTLQAGEFTTPTSHGQVSGLLGKANSRLDTEFETSDLAPWSDFFDAIQGLAPAPPDNEPRIAGRASWSGRIVGPLDGPTFIGHARGEQVRYESLRWDLLEGDITYSPGEFTLVRGRARRGRTEADIELTLELTRWRFAPDNALTLDASVVRAPLADLQSVASMSYPAEGFLTGQFHGRGTRAAPEVTGLFDLAEGRAWGANVERFRGQITWRPDELRLLNAELRAFPAGTANGHGPGIVTGNLTYRFTDRTINLDLTGASLPLDGFRAFQTLKLPVGGRLSFQLKAKGPLTAPTAEGKMRVVDLSFGGEVIGSFDARLTSDGRAARIEIGSAMTEGQVSGTINMSLAGELPLSGDVTVQNMDLDPFLLTALHLKDLTGHGRVDGQFHVSGELLRPESLAFEANLSRFELDYQNVRLENSGPVRFRSSRDELRIEQASLRGSDTNFDIAGSVRFTGSRAVSLRLSGTLNLRLASTFFPQLNARGPAQINASVEGALDRPVITGKLHLENASARYGDFPSGLSGITGDVVFDATRLLFENVVAETGGGKLFLSGTVNYGESPLRYDISGRADRVRVRYPEGMSWLAGGTLRLTGTPNGGILSGRVNVQRLVMTQGFDVASLALAAKEGIATPTTTSPFLRNLQFNIEASTTPDSRMEWPGAEFETEAALRVRGTWEHPILLGHVHLLSGEMNFRGTRYRVTRGELNFSNPFRLVPTLNVEATTTIQQYEITLNFSGPADKLTLAYRSDPPLPANDIITLLALGRTGEESELRSSAASQGPGPGASALLSEAISSQLGGRLERLFGITRFRVDPILAGTGSTGSEQNAAARVTVEQRLTRDLTVTYITNVTSTQQQVIQVEYNVNRNVSIVALRDQNGTFGLDIKLKKRSK